jgi:hypothetical protein
MAAIANLYFDAGDRESFSRWADRAILDAAGRQPVQELLSACRAECRRIDTRQLFGLSPAPPPGDATADTGPSEAKAAAPAPACPAEQPPGP